MIVHILEDPFDRAITFNEKCRLYWDYLFDGNKPDYLLAKLSIINYRVIRAPKDDEYKRGDLITRKDVYLLSL